MIKIGVVNIDVSHPLAFSYYLQKGNRARYTAVYNDGIRGQAEIDAFIKKHGLEKKCESIEELADSVDIGFIQSCNWDDHIDQAMPFIKAGKPVFIDKPVVGSLADCEKLEKLASEGAVILGSSSLRYCEEVLDFAKKDEEEIGKILNVFGTTGVDEFNYAIHVLAAMGPIIKEKPVSNTFVGRTTRDEKICDTYYAKFENDITATYNSSQGVWQPHEFVITTTKSTYQFRIDINKLYGALLDKICDFIEKGENNLASVEELTDSIKIMLAGRISRQQGGGEVKIADIPENDPGFDGKAFEEDYAVKTPKDMYQAN